MTIRNTISISNVQCKIQHATAMLLLLLTPQYPAKRIANTNCSKAAITSPSTQNRLPLHSIPNHNQDNNPAYAIDNRSSPSPCKSPCLQRGCSRHAASAAISYACASAAAGAPARFVRRVDWQDHRLDASQRGRAPEECMGSSILVVEADMME